MTTTVKTGEALQRYVAAHKNTKGKREIAIECGYSSESANGVRANLTAFYQALLEANGVSLSEESSGGSERETRGRKLSYSLRVQQNGCLLIGGAYTKQMGLKPGDEFEIKLGRKKIHLVPVENSLADEYDIDSDEDDGDEDDGDDDLVAA